MTDSRQRDDRTVEARTQRRIVVGVAALAVVGSILSFARAIVESAGQLRATLRGLAPRPPAVLDRRPTTPAVDDGAASAPVEPVTADAATPLLESAPEPAPEPEVADERALPHAGPPGAAEVAQLIDRGLVPDSSAEDALALRAALEAVAP